MIDSIYSILEIMINGAQEVDPRWEKINKAIEGGIYGKSGPDKLRDNAARQIFNQLKNTPPLPPNKDMQKNYILRYPSVHCFGTILVF